jgi:hypothetical protein
VASLPAARLFKSTCAVALACFRQSMRQQWFLLTLVPFAAVVLAAPFLPAASQDAAYRLIVKVVLGGGSAILFVGVILTSSSSLPAEIRDKTVQRSAASPGGRLAILTGRIASFCVLSALVALAGVAGTLGALGLHSLRAGSSAELSSACIHYRATAAPEHRYADKPLTRQTGGVLWIDDKFPSIEWVFPADSLPRKGGLRLRVTPVVASALETRALLETGRAGSSDLHIMELELSDNRQTDVEFPGLPAGTGSLHVRIEKLGDSAPFGFDIRENELNLERNGVSVLTGVRPFALNLLAAWFVVWLKLSFVASLAIFASTFLSAPVAAAFSLVLFLLANVLGFLRDFASGLLEPAGGGCIHCQLEAAEHVPSAFDKLVSTSLNWFTGLYPDLSRFDAAEALVWGNAIPAGFILLALFYMLCYSGILWGASALILRRREF